MAGTTPSGSLNSNSANDPVENTWTRASHEHFRPKTGQSLRLCGLTSRLVWLLGSRHGRVHRFDCVVYGLPYLIKL